MLLKIDASSSQPIHDQLAGQIRSGISNGDPDAGERLPSARDLAESLGVNVHTVLRSFQTLRDEGLLEVRRGRGTIVTGAAPKLAGLQTAAEKLVALARHSGLSDHEIHRLVEVHL